MNLEKIFKKEETAGQEAAPRCVNSYRDYLTGSHIVVRDDVAN